MGTTTEKLQAVLDSKEAIKTSLENQGLEPTDELSTYSGLIDELENTSDATATSADIVEGATAYNAEGKVTGTFSPIAANITYDNATSGLEATTTQGAIDVLDTTMDAHIANKSNPHGVTKSQVGLGNVENKSSETIRGEMTAENVTNALGYTPLNSDQKGAASGLAELDSSGKVPSNQLPSYVDDIIEETTMANFPSTGETGKIYVATTTNKTYRWSGSGYVEVSASLALGETSSTAYRGDRGKVAYAHTSLKTNPHGVTAEQVGLGNVDNTSDKDKPISTAMQEALDTMTTDLNAMKSGSKYKVYNNLEDIGCTSYVFSDVLTAMPDYSILEMDSSNFVTPNSLGSSLKYGIITFTRVSSSRMKIELVTSNKEYYVWHGSSSSVSSTSLELANYSMLTWKLLKQQTGSVNISLTDIDFSELLVRVTPNDAQTYNQVFNIPKAMLSATTISITSNYGQALMVSFYADLSRIKLTSAFDETGADKTSSSTTFVYYR